MDLLEVSGGTYESPGFMGLGRRFGEVSDGPEAYFLDFAVQLRQEVRIPLLLTGGLRTAAAMRQVVGDGTVDMVGLARPLALEPDLPRRILQGTAESSAVRPLPIGWAPVDAMIEAGWHGAQMARMADGKDPAPNLARWRAINNYLGAEAWHAARRTMSRRR